jgi:hypothetical protein
MRFNLSEGSSYLVIFTMMMEEKLPPQRQFVQEPHRSTFQKAAVYIVTALKISNFILLNLICPPSFSN